MAVSKSKPFIFFFLAIIAVSVGMFLIEWNKRRVPSLVVSENRGIGEIFTVDGRLVTVFLDGLTCAWDWRPPHGKLAEFRIGSGRAIPLRGAHLGAVTRMGDRHLLSIYDLDAARKVKDLTIGWEDQDVHVRISNDRGVPVAIRRNPERNGRIEYELLIVDVEAEILRPAILQSIEADIQTFRDFAVSDKGVLYVAGADGGNARLLAMDLNTGQTLWEKIWTDADELTSVALTIDGRTVWAGDHSANLLSVDAEDGRRLSYFSLLLSGETRPANNDYKVLNLTPAPDGRQMGCTIAPIVYVLDIETEQLRFRHNPRQKVTSRVAFSPDSKKIATTSLRADGEIRIWTLE